MTDTGPAEPALYDYAKNHLWLEVVALVVDLLVWMQALAFNQIGPARR